jgi:hypothetical protein
VRGRVGASMVAAVGVLAVAHASAGSAGALVQGRHPVRAPPGATLSRLMRSTAARAAPPATRRASLRCVWTHPLTGVFEVQTSAVSAPVFYLTHNFTTYVPTSAPPFATAPTPAWAICRTGFTTPTIGWHARPQTTHGPSELYETTDGGGQWTLVRHLGCGGSSPWAWVRFVNATDGWLASGDIGGNCYVFQRTVDAGRTWVALPLPGTTVRAASFVSPKLGFVAIPGTRVGLLETTDGGTSWRRIKAPVHAAGTPLAALPVVSGRAGVIPMIVMRTSPSELTVGKAAPVTVVFDTSRDGGRSWVPGPKLETDAPLGVTLIGEVGRGEISDGPAVAVASPTTWWVLSLSEAGNIEVQVTNDAGRHWARRAGDGLPRIDMAALRTAQTTTPVPGLRAITDRIALARVMGATGSTSTYLTTDGGSRWGLLTSLPFGATSTSP